jgi:hypothetical protein
LLAHETPHAQLHTIRCQPIQLLWMLKTGLSALRAMRTTLQLAAPSSRLRVLRLCVTAAGKGPASAAGGARKLSGSSKPAKDGRAAAAPSTTHSQQQQQQQQAAPQEHFYANELHTFASLGLNPAVCQAVEAAGFERPSRVQVGTLSSR